MPTGATQPETSESSWSQCFVHCFIRASTIEVMSAASDEPVDDTKPLLADESSTIRARHSAVAAANASSSINSTALPASASSDDGDDAFNCLTPEGQQHIREEPAFYGIVAMVASVQVHNVYKAIHSPSTGCQ